VTPSVLTARGVTKSYGAKAVLRGFDLEVGSGEIFGLFGSNGSGKSTLLRILAGALRPTAGSVAVRGLTGYVAQRFSLYPDLSVEENLSFFARCYALEGAAVKSRVDRVMERVGLAPYRRERSGELSHGWRQRLSLAAALSHEPALLLLDEATAGLDPGARAALWDVLANYARGGGAVVLATHFLDEGDRCGRVGRIVEGRMAEGVFA
jgi:ABC-2 type transport system ATP-binding protein